MNWLIISNVVLLLLLIAITWRFLIFRGWLKWANAELDITPLPIVAVELAQIDPIFQGGELGPGLQSEVLLVGGVFLGGTSEREAWILAVLAKRASLMFEFGTATGRTAFHWARNSSPDARIVTLTLPAERTSEYRHSKGDDPGAYRHAITESQSTAFYYSGTLVEHKITQLFGDSKAFDCEAYAGQFDLIFIDGSHAASYVRNDTLKALRMIKPGGLILWHDYMTDSPEVKGVFEYLNELRHSLPLQRIARTRLVTYRAPMPDRS